MKNLVEMTCGIYCPLIGLLLLALIWPFALLGTGIAALGSGIVWVSQQAHEFVSGRIIEPWV